MPKEKKPPVLREQALACLARREHSRTELARKLAQSGHVEEDIAALLDDFEARNWLSDRRFAESYVADHRARSGPLKLAFELRQRGVADSLIEEVLAQTRDSELERAREVWRKKFGTPAASAQEKAKQMRFLQGRGFSMETIRLALKATQSDG
ncbi:recombination regulator RecX [Betaproteobacteria bacterium SCN2]|jgi:regulatory protein|nr:recombination regulator RecX [Betaproteobacteria bacterium SCN2]